MAGYQGRVEVHKKLTGEGCKWLAGFKIDREELEY